MYITGMCTEHCTIFSVILGLHDFTTDYYCTQPLHYCRRAPKSNGLITDLQCGKSCVQFIFVRRGAPFTALHTGCHEKD